MNKEFKLAFINENLEGIQRDVTDCFYILTTLKKAIKTNELENEEINGTINCCMAMLSKIDESLISTCDIVKSNNSK